jgi:hypothetical protein
MANPAPFSVTPDAEDYLRSRLNALPRGAEPVIIMATRLGEALDSRAKKIRYWYEGENFDVCCFDPAEQPHTEQIEFLGRKLSITPEALKHLTGDTLALRRVKSAYGLIADQRYVLVASSAQAATDISPETSGRMRDNLSVAALTILGGFSGMGIIWIAFCLIAPLLKIPDSKFLALIVPLFVIVWIVSAIVSFFFFQSVFEAKGETRYVREQTQEKYLGPAGSNADLSVWIFFGIPLPLTIVLAKVLEHFARTIGQKTAVVFVAIMVVGVPTMYFCDRIPHKIVIRFGLLGWALTILGGYWYFKTYGP